MAMNVTRAKLWAASIEDQPGGLHEKLSALAAAGANLEFIFARRAEPGAGAVFVTPLTGAKQMSAARELGFETVHRIQAVRIETPDRPGVGAEITGKLAAAGISMRGFSASVYNKRGIIYIAFDSDADAEEAVRVLKRKG